MNLYDEELHRELLKFYLDKDFMTVYHGRWDSYLVVNNNIAMFSYLIMRTDRELSDCLKRAKKEADKIRNSPLMKALQEG